jgi:hypothetical protein
MDYTSLSLIEIKAALAKVAGDARATFGGLDRETLNWSPDAARWSIGQLFEHLIASNDLVVARARAALSADGQGTVWQHIPWLPGLAGRLLIRSLAPTEPRKYTAPKAVRPPTGTVDAAVTERFAQQNDALAGWLDSVDERQASRRIMVSPFTSAVAYSVMDGLRILVTHEHRHLEQARRLVSLPGFPSRNDAATARSHAVSQRSAS